MPRRNRRGRIRRAHDRRQRTDILAGAGPDGGVIVCPSGKAGFKRHVAEAKLVEYSASDRRRMAARVYLCRDCGAWHLTSEAQHG